MLVTWPSITLPGPLMETRAVSSGPGVASSVMAVVTLLAALFTAMASKPPVPVMAPKVMMMFSDPSARRSSIVARLNVALLL